MVKKITVICIMAVMLCVLCSCAEKTNEQISYYTRDHISPEIINTAVIGTVSSYDRLCEVLRETVKTAQVSASIIIENYSGNLEQDLEKATDYIMGDYPVGNFCIESIMYNTNKVASFCELQVFISYDREPSQIAGVTKVYSLNDLSHRIGDMIKFKDTEEYLYVENLKLSESELQDVFYNEWANSGYNAYGVKYIDFTAYPDFNSSEYLLEVELFFAYEKNSMVSIASECERVAENTVNDCVTGITYEKLLYVYDWLIKNVECDVASSLEAVKLGGTQPKTREHTAAGALLDGRASHSGIVLAASVMLNELNVKNRVLQAEQGGELYYLIYAEAPDLQVYFDPYGGYGRNFDTTLLTEEQAREKFVWKSFN